MTITSNDSNSYLIFRIENQHFGLTLNHVIEVLLKQEITQVPLAPDFIKGVLHFRGEILPILQTPVVLESQLTLSSKNIVIVLEFYQKDTRAIVGLAVDAVSDVLVSSQYKISSAPVFGMPVNLKYVTHILEFNGNIVMLLDAQTVFESQYVQLF